MSGTIIRARNVHEALGKGISLLKLKEALPVAPRGAPTREWNGPVMTVYDRPEERVLFMPERDANPFFHLFESLWMLDGRNDVSFLVRFNKRMAEYSDDGDTLRGAYGYRWRESFEMDQIDTLVRMLRSEPDTRRAVLTMWDPDKDLGVPSKDLPCNTQVFFKVRDGRLRTTVMCRSNDMLWGAYGANAVHFSMLHEYVADKVGVETGPMFQLSDSFHVYTTGPGGALWDKLCALEAHGWPEDPYKARLVESMPIGANHPLWDQDREAFFQCVDGGLHMNGIFKTPWFRGVVKPMYAAFVERSPEIARGIVAPDWRRACVEWLTRRTR